MAGIIEQDGSAHHVAARPPTHARLIFMANLRASTERLTELFGKSDFDFEEGVNSSCEGWQVHTPDGTCVVYRHPSEAQASGDYHLWRVECPPKAGGDIKKWLAYAVTGEVS